MFVGRYTSDDSLPSVSSARPSRRPLRRLYSLPDDVTERPGHVTLSSARLLAKMTSTLNALTVDCRQYAARNHGNGVAMTASRRHSDGRTLATSDARSRISNRSGIVVAENPIIQNRAGREQLDTQEVRTVARLDSSASECRETVAENVDSTHAADRIQHHHDDHPRMTDDRPSGDRIDVVINKGPLGLGFCIDGGRDTPAGPAPITVKRLFKGLPVCVFSRTS